MATADAISSLVTKAFHYLDNYGKAQGMENVKKCLRLAMRKILTVFHVASPERIRQQIRVLDAWLWHLRGAVEEVEDSIDELEYYQIEADFRKEEKKDKLEAKAQDPKVSGERGSSFAKMKHKIVRSVKHASICESIPSKCTQRVTVKRLVKALDGLAKVAEGVDNVFAAMDHFRRSELDGKLVNNDEGTVLASNAAEFLGREKEKKQIIGWLTRTSDESVSNMNSIPIVSVVGHGGMGKTALAQRICEEEEVLKYFKVIWVTVSPSFDATLLTCKILECLTGAKPSANSLDPLQQYLKEKVKSVKFLLVLDDVWEDNKLDEWERLFAPLRQAITGSKILLTTRMQSVSDMAASVMGVKRDQCLTLQELEEDKNLELFNYHVSSVLNSKDYMQLTSIGEQIARKLGGCPLVTKITGGHLRDNMTMEYWSRFLDGGLESFKLVEDDIISVLRLSYYHLPTELQACFRYCSLFPVDHEFRKEELVNMWIGSGLISETTSPSQSMKDTAEQVLAQLTRKSFFDLKSRSRKGAVKNQYYLMNYTMHELARTMSSGECARITDPTRFGDEKDTVRHLCLAQLQNISVEQINKISCFKNLRTIIIDSNCEAIDEIIFRAIEKNVEGSKSLRLIHSTLRNTFQFPGRFVNLKHLRYIDLDGLSPEGMFQSAKLYRLTWFHCQSGMQRATL